MLHNLATGNLNCFMGVLSFLLNGERGLASVSPYDPYLTTFLFINKAFYKHIKLLSLFQKKKKKKEEDRSESVKRQIKLAAHILGEHTIRIS